MGHYHGNCRFSKQFLVGHLLGFCEPKWQNPNLHDPDLERYGPDLSLSIKGRVPCQKKKCGVFVHCVPETAVSSSSFVAVSC